MAAHSLAELYAVLTTLPTRPRISPTQAGLLIGKNVEELATVVSLSAAECRAVIAHLVELGLSGGVIYDALIARPPKSRTSIISSPSIRPIVEEVVRRARRRSLERDGSIVKVPRRRKEWLHVAT